MPSDVPDDPASELVPDAEADAEAEHDADPGTDSTARVEVLPPSTRGRG